MSKIKALRIINLNYNNNSIRMEDEKFYFEGENTLLSLQNGGGKSVLVQMMMAPFVHKRYRDIGERGFASYFTTNKPTHILVEWQLDGGASYVLVGMSVRKRQTVQEGEGQEELEILSFIHEYKEKNLYDINSFPVIECVKKEKRLLGFNACRQLYEEIRKERGIHFGMYELTQFNAQRQYFNRLKEYKINHEEWETIIKKINLKESGLSELFKNAKDEAGLIEKWFLPAVETKLNCENNRIKQFQEMIQKYMIQYKDNQSKIEKKDTIHAFQEDALELKKLGIEYDKASQSRQMQEEKLAYVIKRIQGKVEELHRLLENMMVQKQEYTAKARRIEYEKVSYELYRLMDEMKELCIDMEQVGKESNAIKEQLHGLQMRLHILECARLYQDYKKEEAEVLTLENQLQLKRSKEQKLLPERDELGFNLRMHYEKKLEQVSEEITKCEEKILDVQHMQEEVRQKEAEACKESDHCIEEQVRLGEHIKGFDEVEKRFNQTFSQNLQRNILGYYEEEKLLLVRQQEEKKRDSLVSKLNEKKCRNMEVEKERKYMDREMQDKSTRKGQIEGEKQKYEELLLGYENELEERKVAMRYLSIEEEYVFDTKYLVNEFSKKIALEEQQKHVLVKELEKQEREEEKLRTGKIVELPKELLELLEQLRINYVYGMDYLKQAGMAKKQKEALLAANPMLPYSILLNEKDIVSLQQEQIPFYTSYPIPVVKREQLKYMEQNDSVNFYVTKLVSFFYSFNTHLIEEEALNELIQKKQEAIALIKERVSKKEKELELYRMKQGDIRCQKVTRADYQQAKGKLEEVRNQAQELEQALQLMHQKKEQLEEEYRMLQKEIYELEKKREQAEELLNALIQITEEYEEYTKQRSYLVVVNKKANKIKEEQLHLVEKREQLIELKQELNEARRYKSLQRKEIDKKTTYYASYRKGAIRNQEVVDLEARFEAITKTLHGELLSLEENLEKAKERFQEIESRLNSQSTKYALTENQFNQITYDDYKVLELEQQVKKQEEEREKALKRYNSLDKKHAVKEAEYNRLLEKVRQRFQTEELVPKEELVQLEFAVRSKEVSDKLEKLEHSTLETEKAIRGYEAQQSALAKYEQFETKNEFTFEQELLPFHKKDMFTLTLREFNKFQAGLQRAYDAAKEQEQDNKDTVTRQIELFLRKRCYEDEFFLRPIETMYNLIASPRRLLEQLDINSQTFEMVLQKLEVDLAFIGKEKDKLIEMLLDYCLDVHSNLDKIDKNSSIVIREKAVKMLQLKLMDVEDQENILKIRLTDYMEELMTSGLIRLNENENIEELIGKRITTKALYDAVIGIHSIQIQLYKIEQQRECKISWSEVSKNSGGEGFLSAFVILTSLLSYMRRDDTDIFLTHEEGKVIIMDNPFAQTNAAHLLTPLMELAKKSNTQLICLSGLGGESIYNCFDNIFVLNLTQATLQNALQYVKSEQIKGDVKIYEINSSRVQVMEQMELLF